MDILESLERNAARKSTLDADRKTMEDAAREIRRLRSELGRAEVEKNTRRKLSFHLD